MPRISATRAAAMMKLPGTVLMRPSSRVRPNVCGEKITATAPHYRSRMVDRVCSSASDWSFGESLHVADRLHPWQSIVAKYLARWRHRFRVVQGADMED